MARKGKGAGKGGDHTLRPPGDYTVGYGRPPKSGQFKSGQSGNPKGRPKGGADMDALLAKELSQKLNITVDGVRYSLTKFQVLAKRLTNKAIEGDLKATAVVMAAMARYEMRISAEQKEERSAKNVIPPGLPDVEKLSLQEIETVLDAIRILEGGTIRPKIPMPPGYNEDGEPE